MAVPKKRTSMSKKRTSMSKKRIRRNIWRKKAYLTVQREKPCSLVSLRNFKNPLGIIPNSKTFGFSTKIDSRTKFYNLSCKPKLFFTSFRYAIN